MYGNGGSSVIGTGWSIRTAGGGGGIAGMACNVTRVTVQLSGELSNSLARATTYGKADNERQRRVLKGTSVANISRIAFRFVDRR